MAWPVSFAFWPCCSVVVVAVIVVELWCLVDCANLGNISCNYDLCPPNSGFELQLKIGRTHCTEHHKNRNFSCLLCVQFLIIRFSLLNYASACG